MGDMTIVRHPPRQRASYVREPGPIDLGDEPAMTLAVEGEDDGPLLKSVSWRWLTGTVLTGITSIFLMGTALTGALSTPGQYASLPVSAAPTPREAEFGKKGDRIVEPEERVSNRQVLKVSTVTRQGGQDFIKLRPFARINATLSTRRGELADQVPKYDPIRIFADTSGPDEPVEDIGPEVADDDELYGATVDGEVAVRVSPFPVTNPDLEPAAHFTPAEVEHIVLMQARQDGPVYGTARALAFAATPVLEDLDSIDAGAPSFTSVSIIPENLSNIAKSDASGRGGLSEAVVSITDTGLQGVLSANDVSESAARQIMAALTPLADLDALGAQDRIRIGYEPGADESTPRTMRVSIYRDGVHQATVARADSGVFVRADEPSSLLNMVAGAPEAEQETCGGSATLYNAVYEAALEQEIPEPLIDQIVKIFAFDVDFQARASAGDSIEVFHSLADEDDAGSGEPEILYAALEHDGTMKRFYRFRTPDDGVVDYYDEEGKSAKKFLMRKPVADGALRSRYGMRRHPVLGVRRLHAGVDYGAKRGTPIFAAGNGVIKKMGRSSGYGNLTTLRHTNGYETRYAHQTRFAKGLKVGSRVRQGQIIGYVGSTGLSTGPHLHYEIRVNGKPVDPLRIRLPQGRVLQDEVLATFQHERERIDRLLGIETPTQLASN